MTLDAIASNYCRAEITTVWVHHRQFDRHLMLFCVVELCPVDQPVSPALSSKGYPQIRISVNGHLTLYGRREFVGVEEGIKFFRDSGEGRLPFLQAPEIVTAGPLAAFLPEEEPILIPSNLCEQSGLGAVLPRRPTSLSVLSKFDTESSVTRVLDKDCDSVAERITEIIDVNLQRFPEHWGALHLCFSNPILRRTEQSITRDSRTLLLHCFERTGKSIVGCQIELTNEWPPVGQGFSEWHTLQSPYMAIPLPAQPNRFRVRLFDANGRCLENENPGTFIRNISSTTSTVTTDSIEISSSGGAVQPLFIETATVIDDPPMPAPARPPSPLEHLVSATREREVQDLADAKIFNYFSGDASSRAEAMQILRELIRGARTRCTIIDSFLDRSDVISLIPFVFQSSCKVRFLSSHKRLSSRDRDDVTEEFRLSTTIEELSGKLPFSIEARKMRGDGVHDRLLEIDDDIYLLGSSFNHFGSRATVLFKLQRPEAMRREIDAWWSAAIPLCSLPNGRTFSLLFSRLKENAKSLAKTVLQIVVHLFSKMSSR